MSAATERGLAPSSYVELSELPAADSPHRE
jgi:hypothetical protein